MKKQTQELDILEMLGGHLWSYERQYPGKSILAVGKSHIAFSDLSVDRLALKQGSSVILAKNKTTVFISIPPAISNLNGYTVQKKRERLYVSCKQYLAKNEIVAGHYEIGEEAVFYKNIDWYPLRLLKAA